MVKNSNGRLVQKDIVKQIMERVGIPEKEAKAILNSFLKSVSSEVLDNGNTITLQWFGRFFPEHKNARLGRNPKTGEPAEIKPRTRLKFVAAKTMKNSIEAYRQ